MIRKKEAEKGQSIVIIALVMVVLLAAVGLAIDGGGMLLLKRDTQNAVDAAVMAAAYARCTRGNVELAAVTAAKENGFSNGVDDTIVTVNRPPLAGPKAGDPEFVEVIISKEKPKYFIQVVYGDPLIVTSRGVGYCKPGTEMFANSAIFAASETCSNAADLSGSKTYVEGGIYSGTDAKLSGGEQQFHGYVNAVGNVENNNGTFYPSSNNPTGGADPYENIPLLYDVKEFRPGGDFADFAETKNGGATNFTGRKGEYYYFSGDVTLPGSVWPHGTKLKGLIYAKGSVTLNQAAIDPNVGVTIISDGDNTQIQVNNNVKDQVIKAFLPNGLLFFSTAKAKNCGGAGLGIEIAGSNNRLYGLLYAPFAAITISGSDTRIEGALIGDTVGNSASDTVIIYDPSVVPPTPPEIVVAE